MSKLKDKTYFSKDWLTDPDFMNWLADTNDNTVRFVIQHLNSLIWEGKH